MNADQLLILTDVECVYKDFGKEKQEPIHMMDCAAARKYMEEGQFGEGNMRPKIETALSFIGDFSTRSVLITMLGSLREAIQGRTGTVIRK